MEDQENRLKISKKRRISTFEEDMVSPKRQSLSSDVNDCDNSFTNPRAIAASCLTDDFRLACKMNTKSETPSNIGTPEEQIVSLAEFGKLPKPHLNSFDGKNLPSNNIRGSFDRTPEEQILPIDQFNKLPKPLITSSGASSKNCSVNVEACQKVNLDDSFEVIKYNLKNSQSTKPLKALFNPSFMTPETPCELNDIDVENEFPVVAPLPCLERLIPTRKSKYFECETVSPMFYENENRISKVGKKRNRVKYYEHNISKEPLLDAIDHNQIEELSAEEVSQIIDNEYVVEYDNIPYVHHIIDCRYPYEYEGGHITGAANLYTPYQLLLYVFLTNFDENVLRRSLVDAKTELKELLDIVFCDQTKIKSKNKAFIFHCEFSSIRGPEMARCMRNIDRIANIKCYPALFFPKVFIMKKGYSEFYKRCKYHCEPQSYVKMSEVDHTLKMDDNIFDDSFEESDNEQPVDKETIDRRMKEYNICKNESQEQMALISQLTKE